MFIGHFAAAFATKKLAPRISLGTTFMACQLLDLMWPLLLLANIERAEINSQQGHPSLVFTSYPFSHSLIFVLLWSVLFGGVYFLLKKNRREAIVLGALVFSHWILDLIVHQPDLPIFPSGPFVGMGLWSYPALTLVLELGFFAVSVLMYLRMTEAKNKAGTWVLAVLIVFLLGVHLADAFGPQPPNIMAVAVAGNLMWLFVALAYWADKNRATRAPKTL